MLYKIFVSWDSDPFLSDDLFEERNGEIIIHYNSFKDKFSYKIYIIIIYNNFIIFFSIFDKGVSVNSTISESNILISEIIFL